MNHQAVLRVATIQLAEGGGGGCGAFELDKLFLSLPICRTLFFHTLPQGNIYFPFFNFSSVYNAASVILI